MYIHTCSLQNRANIESHSAPVKYRSLIRGVGVETERSRGAGEIRTTETEQQGNLPLRLALLDPTGPMPAAAC
jgi:hypothetical protein